MACHFEFTGFFLCALFISLPNGKINIVKEKNTNSPPF